MICICGTANPVVGEVGATMVIGPPPARCGTAPPRLSSASRLAILTPVPTAPATCPMVPNASLPPPPPLPVEVCVLPCDGMPGTGGEASSTETVATIGDQSVSMVEVRQQLAEIEQRNQVPKALESLYAQQILKHKII